MDTDDKDKKSGINGGRPVRFRIFLASPGDVPLERKLAREAIEHVSGEDAKVKKSTMDTYWVPGVNNLGTYGRWAFAEFTDVYLIQDDFEATVERAFNSMIDQQLN